MAQNIQFDIYSKKYRIFRIFNIVLSCILASVSLGMLIYYIIIGDPTNRILPCILVGICAFLPYIIERIASIRLGNLTILIYTLFMILSPFVGSVLGLFKGQNIYDKICHTSFGYVGNYIGLLIVVQVVDKGKRPWFVGLSCLVFVMACASFWEIFEFVGDSCLGQTAQGVKVNGITPVTDTMWDIIVTLIGATVFQIQYALNIFTKKDWLIDTAVKEFNFQKIERTKNKH